MLTLSINGKKYTCPAHWGEVSTETYQRIFKEWATEPDLLKRDYFQLFSILTGTNFKKSDSTKVEQTIWSAIKWTMEDEPMFHVEPKVMEFKGARVPVDLGKMSIGQMIMIKQTITGVALETVLAKVTAIIMQPAIDGGDFNPDRVEELEKEILSMPITVVGPIGFFSVRRALEYGKKRRSVLDLIRNSLGRKLGAMSRLWRKSQSFALMTTSP